MIEINPYYLFSHVVFINTDKKFICIDKLVYQKIHSIIFRGARSTPRQRRDMRDLFYDSYYNYVYRGRNVDVSKFNRRLFTIYSQVDVRDFDGTTQLFDKQGDMILDDAMPFYVTEDECTGYEDVTDKLEVNQRVDQYRELKLAKVIDDDINVELNAMIVKNSRLIDFVKFLGYNRIINIIRKFICYDSYYLFDDVEFHLLKYLLPIFSKYRLSFFKRYFDFICSSCGGIGCHFKIRFRSIQKCYYSEWFDFNGIIKLDHYHDGDPFRDQPFIDNSPTTAALLKSFRIGYVSADQNSSFSLHMINLANNRYLDYYSFTKNLVGIGLEQSFYHRSKYERYLFLDNWVKNNFFDLNWKVMFDEMVGLYKEIVSYNSSQHSDSSFSLAFGSNVTISSNYDSVELDFEVE